uniref:Uncharacterized protein n=1 Tax=Picea glauca TaxID=3330 RepID=A0A101M1A9_PICGL|nr:hypothetical protein ABT39_MTgene3768 [Picea glauca]QHR86049.1 hypothetical protein Q903MT_gene47 [Picea sitchensis]
MLLSSLLLVGLIKLSPLVPDQLHLDRHPL